MENLPAPIPPHIHNNLLFALYEGLKLYYKEMEKQTHEEERSRH